MPKSDFDVVKAKTELSRLLKRYEEYIKESALYTFALGILDVALPCIDSAAKHFHSHAPQKNAPMLPSTLFAPNGWLDERIHDFHEREGAYKFGWLSHSRSADAQNLYRICASSLEEMLRRLSSAYPSVAFVRYCHYFKFMLEIYYRTIHDDESFRYELSELWSDFVTSELPALSAEMAQAEKDGTVVSVARLITPIPQSTDIFSATEKVISEERTSPVPAVRVAELSSFAFQYYCCSLSRIVDAGTEKLYTIFERGSFYRRFVTLFNDSLLACIGSGMDVDKSLVMRTFLVVSQVMVRVRLHNWDDDIRMRLDHYEMTRMSYSKFLALAFGSNGQAFIPEALRCVRGHDQLLDELAMKMQCFEEKNGVVKRTMKSDPKHPSLFDMPENKVFDWLANEMRSIHKEVVTELKTITRQNDAAARKLEIIRKDVKVVKAEQDSPSHDSKRHGPPVKFPRMVDAAILLLKKWAKENPAPNSSIAARQIFDEWERKEKEGKLKRGNRYKSLKSFQVIVARKWMRPETSS